MAKFFGKDPVTYNKERDGFLRDLQHFHENRGTSFRRSPQINGQEIDLYLLYSLVTAQGGWVKVNAKNEWPDLLKYFRLTGKCVNSGVALKQIYLRYLDRWEKVHFLGEEADRGSDDEDNESNRHKRWSARALHSVPLYYNYHQHNVTEASRENNSLSTDLYKPSDYDRLALSLISELPNEQDFAINVCTVLSNDGKHTLKLEKHPRLVDNLLAHAGVYNHSSLRQLFVYYYKHVRKHSLDSFWPDVLATTEFLDLTNENNFANVTKGNIRATDDEKQHETTTTTTTTTTSSSSLSTTTLFDVSCKSGAQQQQHVTMEIEFNDSGGDERSSCDVRDNSKNDCEVVRANDCDDDDDEGGEPSNRSCRFRFKFELEDRDLFCLGRTLGTQDYTGQRVLQVAQILRNLSFIEDNITTLSKNRTFLRFLLLCSNAKWGSLQSLGLDMLGNIASEFLIRERNKDRLADCLLKVVTRGLHSEDRNLCITSLEVLNKLSQIEANEDVLSRTLDSSVYKKVCSFLTLHDVMLLIYTLECLYSLSSLGERACNYIVGNHGVVDTLVSLVTVEGKSYGPKACIGMKLVETVPGGTIVSAPAAVVNACNNNTTATTSSNNANVASTKTATTPPPPPPPPTLPQIQIAPNTPQKVVVTTSTTTLRNAHVVPHRMVFTTSSPVSLVSTTTTATVPQPTQIQQVVVNSQQLVQQHAHQQSIQENEQFALAWLRATYEPCTNCHIEQQELYKHYINSCAKIGRRGVIAPLHFPRCVRSVFGGSVGPNALKTSAQQESQFYEGIKVRAQPLIISIQSPPNPATTPVKSNVRRKVTLASTVIPVSSPPPTLNCDSTEGPPQASPASPILKAQLSAPTKTPRETTVITSSACKVDSKSQVMAHPHLSHALLGCSAGATIVNASSSSTTTASSTTTIMMTPSSTTPVTIVNPNVQQSGQSNTSLIKSLLATKVNECMPSVSMKIAKDCQNVAQVVARQQQQQRLLAQQVQPSVNMQTPNNKQQQSEIMPKLVETPKSSRINGARQLFCEEMVDSSVTSTTPISTYASGKREPPQPPPPPLVPLTRTVTPRMDEDSNSTGNNSIASSSGLCNVGISSTEDGDNSLTSFEGILLNGVPSIDTLLNEDSNSKDSTRMNVITKNKPLMLADLLEKKVDKDPPLLNGMLGKELRLGEKGLDLVENHIEKALKCSEKNVSNITENNTVMNVDDNSVIEVSNGEDNVAPKGTKRSATEDIAETEVKRANVVFSVNGSASVGSPAPESVSSSSNGGDEMDGKGSVSTAAAKLFADIAADILEDEEEEQFLQEQQQQQQQHQQQHHQHAVTETPNIVQVVQNSTLQQVYVDGNCQQPMIVATQPRQIIVSQPQIPVSNQMVIPGASGFKPGQTVIVQNTAQQRPPQVVIQQANTGQFLLSQGQMQLIPSSTQPGQYVLQTGGTQGAYVVAQSQAAMMHGQPQTVLVAQTPQQQGTGTKTIIILQQPNANTATHHHQKVVVAPQGQQMVVTQVPRPVIQTASTITTTPVVPTTTVIKTTPTSVITPVTTVTTVPTPAPVPVASVEKKEEPKIAPKTKPKVIRDLSTPFVCEWGECQCETKFKSANQVYMHVCEAHCPETIESEIVCQWERCDNMKRKRFSLMTHIYDKHCNTEAMKMAQIRRKQVAQSGKSEPPVNQPATPHPGYAPDAALHAIKRHALEFVNPKELQDDNEGPVTKSIRLTASLILRNLVIYSNNCRRYLRHYEPHLANVALSNVESSRTIAQILYDMNDGAGHR